MPLGLYSCMVLLIQEDICRTKIGCKYKYLTVTIYFMIVTRLDTIICFQLCDIDISSFPLIKGKEHRCNFKNCLAVRGRLKVGLVEPAAADEVLANGPEAHEVPAGVSGPYTSIS